MIQILTLTTPQGEQIEITPTDQSHLIKSLDGTDTLTLKYSTTKPTEIPVGTSVEYQGTTYTLEAPTDLQMIHTELYNYTISLQAPSARIKNYIVTNTIDGRIDFPYTATPTEHLQLIIDNLNKRETGWKIGDTLQDTATKLIRYTNTDCHTALHNIATEFGTELYINEKVISIANNDQHEGDPLPLKYGQGNGLLSDIKRVTPDQQPIATLYLQTSDRNIDPHKYGARTLRLPKNTTHNGCTTNHDGTAISIAGSPKGSPEGICDLTQVYPKREGVVTSVQSPKSGLFDIVDNTIPDALDFNNFQIAGQAIKLVFQTGELAGREFEANYQHPKRLFQIVPTEEEGITIPNTKLAPKEGDKYGVFEIALPEEYIKQAEQELLQRATAQLHKQSQTKETIIANVDPIFAKKNWNEIAHHLQIGRYIQFSDPKWHPAPTLIRIQSITTYLHNPYSPKIELSNAPISLGKVTAITQEVKQQESRRRQQGDQIKELKTHTYQQTEQVRGLIEQLQNKHFTESIRPETLQTLYAVIGDPSRQFAFVDSKGTEVPFQWQEDAKGTITIPRQTIATQEQGNTLSPTTHRTTTEIPTLTYTLKAEQRQVYLYVSGGKFKLTEKPDEAGRVIGIITGEQGQRTLTPLYGFTEITPGQLQTDLIRSKDGQSFWDLVSGKLQTKSDFIVGDPSSRTALAYIGGTLYLKGAMIGVGRDETTIEDAIAEQERKLTEEAKAREQAHKALQQALDDAKKSNSDDTATLTDLLQKVNTAITSLQEQVDGEVSNWFYSGAPSPTRPPESEWTSNNLKARHIGDTYTSTDTEGEYMGKSWRYTTEFKWQEIHDTLISQALHKASKAQTTADGKNTTFLTEPTNYQSGDTWVLQAQRVVNGTTHEAGTLLFATHSSTAFVHAHWVDKLKYASHTDLTTSEAKAKQAWEAYATAQAKLAETTAKAHADGKVTAEEQARIDADKKALETAKAYAEAQDKLLKTQQEAYTDGKVTEAEKRAIEVAEKEAKLAETNANAYADGVLTEAEKKAIAQAQKAYDNAVAKAREMDGQIQVGGRNLLRNKDIIDTIANKISVEYEQVQPKEGRNTYTLSFEYWIDENDTATSRRISLAGAGLWIERVIADSKWHRVEHTIQLTLDESKYPLKWWLTDYNSRGNRVPGMAKVRNIKLERGTVATDWSPAPEDVASDIAKAQKQADKAVADAHTAQERADDTYTKATMDSIITREEQEAIAREAEVARLANLYADNKKAEAINTANVYTDSKATELEQTRTKAMEEQSKLIKKQYEAYADGVVSEEEKKRIKEMQEAQKQAQAEYARLQKAQTLIGAIGTGKPLFSDPTFATSDNGVKRYNHSQTPDNTLTHISREADNPTKSTHQLRYYYAGGAASPGVGGFSKGVYSRPNGVFIAKIIAKIPKGYGINNYQNSVGNAPTHTWLTSQAGTGKYETYYYALECSSEGVFATFGFFAFHRYSDTPAEPQTFDIAFYQVYDITDYYNASKELQDAITTTQQSITNLQTEVNTTLRDGIIDEAERKSLQGQIDLLLNERDQIIASYNKVYANSQLAGTPKSNLLNAKISYFGAVNNLIDKLKALMTKAGAITKQDRNEVTTQFGSVRDALTTLQIRLDEATEYLRKVVEGKADTAQQEAQSAQQEAQSAQQKADTLKTELTQGLSDANTAIKALEQADEAIKAGLVEDFGNLQYLVDAFRKGGAGSFGLLLTRAILLSGSDDKVNSIISGDTSTKAFRAGIKHGSDGSDTQDELLALYHDGRAKFGNMFVQQEQDGQAYISFKDDIKEEEYLKVGGVTKKETELVDSSSYTSTIRGIDYTARTSGDTLTSSFYITNKSKIRATGELDVRADAEYPHRTGEYNSANITARVELRIYNSNGLKQKVTTNQIKASVSLRRNDGSSPYEPTRPDDNVQGKHSDSETLTFDLTIPDKYVTKGDRVELFIVVTNIQKSGSAWASAMVSNVSFEYKVDTSKPWVHIAKEKVAFFFGRTKYILMNYFTDWVMKIVGNVLINGNLQIQGQLTADNVEAPGIPLVGAMVKSDGGVLKSFGKYKNRQGYSNPQVTWSWSSYSYTVHHSIGHADYIPLLTVGNHLWSDQANWSDIGPYSFTVTITNGNNEKNQQDFTFVCFKTD